MSGLSSFVAKALASNTEPMMIYMPSPYRGDQTTIWGRFFNFCQNNLWFVALIVLLVIALIFFLTRAFSKKRKKVK